MSRFRRTRWAVYFHERAIRLGLRELLAGELALEPATHIVAASALTGDKTPLAEDELELLGRLDDDRWTAAAELDGRIETAQRLAARGLVVADDEAGPLASLRERDERLNAEEWNRFAALFHFLDRARRGVTVTSENAALLAPQISDALQGYVDVHGPPPPEFHKREARATLALPVEDIQGELYDALRARRTTRAFADTPISLVELSTLLRCTFGCHGYWPFVPGLATLRKFAPSGGGLHPIEAYPIVLNVDGVVSGVHHYDVERHSLDLLAERDSDDLRESLTPTLCGQEYLVENAAALVVLSVRFFRNFWKYRRDARAYAALLLDAGHLSQTFQLVAADLGVGSFFTAGFDGPSLETLIDVEGVTEGALAVVGCGRPTPERSFLDCDPDPFVPRRGP